MYPDIFGAVLSSSSIAHIYLPSFRQIDDEARLIQAISAADDTGRGVTVHLHGDWRRPEAAFQSFCNRLPHTAQHLVRQDHPIPREPWRVVYDPELCLPLSSIAPAVRRAVLLRITRFALAATVEEAQDMAAGCRPYRFHAGPICPPMLSVLMAVSTEFEVCDMLKKTAQTIYLTAEYRMRHCKSHSPLLSCAAMHVLQSYSIFFAAGQLWRLTSKLLSSTTGSTRLSKWSSRVQQPLLLIPGSSSCQECSKLLRAQVGCACAA